MRNEIIQGDALAVLRTLPPESVHMCVTSPPYYGLREHPIEPTIWDGAADCAHEWDEEEYQRRSNDNGKTPKQLSNHGANGRDVPIQHAICSVCGAWRGQLGQEPTPDLYIAHLVQVFREVRRVLRKDGTCWLNMGDSFWGSGPNRQENVGNIGSKVSAGLDTRGMKAEGFKPKDLMMMPARVAIALQSDGWHLRQDNIWSKPNPMPESMTDRPTTTHEHVFLLSKSGRYFYDAEAVKEPVTGNTHSKGPTPRGDMPKTVEMGKGIKNNTSFSAAVWWPVETRNRRSVWTIATQSYKEAHFATFPEKLVKIPILAGTSPQACEHCGSPWARVVEKTPIPEHIKTEFERQRQRTKELYGRTDGHVGTGRPKFIRESETTGWRPTCKCENSEGSGKCVVFDPFMGSGTVAQVALELGRDYLGIEASTEYIELAEVRSAQRALFSV